MKRTLTLTTALLAMITGPAFAGDMHEKAEDKAEHAWSETKDKGEHAWNETKDAARDAKEDSMEAAEDAEENLEAFSRYDENNDGELQESEFTSYYSDEEAFANLEFDKLDANSDNIISEQEWREHFNGLRATQQQS